MSYTIISGALETKLATWVNIPTVAYENESYTPIIGTRYLRAYNVPSIAQPNTLGDPGSSLIYGTFYLDLMNPAGEGRGTGDELADELIQVFKKGTVITLTGLNIHVITSGRETSQSETDWYMIPIRVKYWCKVIS